MSDDQKEKVLERLFTEPIRATGEDLEITVDMDIHTYTRGAIETIDDILGDGFAKDHPKLIGSLVTATAIKHSAYQQSQTIQEATLALVQTIKGETQGVM